MALLFHERLTRRAVLQAGACALLSSAQAQTPPAGLTKFQTACMTLPYSAFPFERALEGIARAGYKFVAWGTNHRDAAGQRAPLLAADAPASAAKKLAEQTRGAGLEPVMMFSGINVEAPNSVEAHTRRIEQAAAARIPFLLTFGSTKPTDYGTWIRNLKQLGPVARQAGVTIVLKPHGGNTATGEACARIVGDAADEAIKICYDSGNVLDYQDVDPIADIQTCWRDIRAFAIKDHRNTPKDEDCGPGFGEIDHYKLLLPVARTGLSMPLACENIFEPIVPRPTTPEGVDTLARRAREFLETVIRGIQA